MVATKSQAETTRALVDLTGKMFAEEHRPWIAIDVAWGAPVYRLLSFQLTNYGTAPGVITGWTVLVTKNGREIAKPEAPSPSLSYIFPARSDYRPPVVFDDEQVK